MARRTTTQTHRAEIDRQQPRQGKSRRRASQSRGPAPVPPVSDEKRTSSGSGSRRCLRTKLLTKLDRGTVGVLPSLGTPRRGGRTGRPGLGWPSPTTGINREPLITISKQAGPMARFMVSLAHAGARESAHRSEVDDQRRTSLRFRRRPRWLLVRRGGRGSSGAIL